MKVGDIVRVDATKEALEAIGVDIIDVLGRDFKVKSFFQTGYVEIESDFGQLGELKFDIPKEFLRVVDNSVASLVERIVDIIDNDELTLREYNQIQSAVKNHVLYDYDDLEVEFDDVKDYINYAITDDEWDCLKELYGEAYTSSLRDIEIKTLDDEQRVELLAKLYNETTNYPELRLAINSKYGKY